MDSSINKTTSYADPRLAFARSKKQKKSRAMENYSFFDETSTALSVVKSRNLSGLCAIVTGGNRGVGLEIAKTLAFTGCRVIIGCRNVIGANCVCDIIKVERVCL